MHIKRTKIYHSSNFSIYFGNKTDPKPSKAFGLIQTKLQAKSFTVFTQVHGTQGHLVSRKDSAKRTGDILLTCNPGCAIGVLTADCLPIIFYDPNNHACAIAHAGWRGTVAGVAQETVRLMHSSFRTDPSNLQVYFGPSAQVCCYEVDSGFSRYIEKQHHSTVFIFKNKKLFFDNAKLNHLKLCEVGVLEKNISLKHNVCTICDCSYHSYRRDGKSYGHQVTAVSLTEPRHNCSI